ncbi:MAG: PTS sugar transporter subunit IIC [Erysipelotrichaceae bacterium]
MNEISIVQILLLTAYGFIAIWDDLNPGFKLGKPVVAGMFAGLIMGDISTGLLVGGTLQLMILGVGTYGGASIPDYMTGAIVGTAFAVSSGKGLEYALAIAVPVGLLMVQLDVLGRFTNTYFQHMADKGAEERNYRKVEMGNLLGILPWGLSRALPIFLALFFGQDIVATLLNNSPEWLMNGLKVAGGLLPALGIAILLRYMPLKQYWTYAIAGFVAATYLKIPMLGVALVGLVAAGIAFMKADAPKAVVSVTNEGGTIEDDE